MNALISALKNMGGMPSVGLVTAAVLTSGWTSIWFLILVTILVLHRVVKLAIVFWALHELHDEKRSDQLAKLVQALEGKW